MGQGRQRIIIGISGASGTPIAIALLGALRDVAHIETHLVISEGGRLTLAQESHVKAQEIVQLADVVYNNNNIGASIASGSFKTAGMIVVPCSMKTLAAVNCGYGENLLQRAADVTIKEQRKLALVTRECPLSLIHLRNMYELSQIGVRILPPVVSYYNQPKTIDDVTYHIVGKILDSFDIAYDKYKRWEGLR